MDQRVGFCNSFDGTRIGYAISGNGPPLVRAATWMTHVELDRDGPPWGHWWRTLSRRHTFIRYDLRGCGLSDWSPREISFEACVRDLEALVDSLGLERFVLFGPSLGGGTALEYTFRHPERVSRLVIFGGFARGSAKRGRSNAEWKAVLTLMAQGLNDDHPAYRAALLSRYNPTPDTDQEYTQAWSALMKGCTTGANAVRISESVADFEIVSHLKDIAVPTLVMHSRGEVLVPAEEGRLIAGMVPDARYVELPSRNHTLVHNEPAWAQFQQEFERFTGVDSVGRADAGSGSNDVGLSSREIEVLRLVAAGGTDKAIADELGLSRRTIGNHITRILDRTGSSSRAQAVAWGAHQGLI